MKHHISIDDETMTVLRASAVSETSVKLPPAHLPRPLYVKVNKVLKTAGGKWNKSAQAHIFTTDPRPVLGLAVEKGAILDTKKATQAFYTPRDVANIVARHASVNGKHVLEPSAGHGSLADACMRHHAKSVLCIENDPVSVAHLRRAFKFDVIEDDFLGVQPTPFDRVVMNPPFTGGQDVAHVTHAFKFLKPRGRLIAIMSTSWETAQNKKSAAFREIVSAHGRIAERIESGAFKESGTNIATVIVIIDKTPSDSAALV